MEVNTLEEAKKALEEFLKKKNLVYSETSGPTPYGKGHFFRLVVDDKTYYVYENGHVVV